MGNREEKLRKMNHWFTLPRTYKEKKISTLFLHLFFHNIGWTRAASEQDLAETQTQAQKEILERRGQSNSEINRDMFWSSLSRPYLGT